MKLAYLILEAPREGQASYVHVCEIIDGLKKQGVKVTLYQPPYTSKSVSPHLIIRLLHAVLLQIKLWLGWKKGSILYIRAHYLAFPSAVLARILGIPVFQEINGPYEDVFVTYPSLNKLRRILIPMQRYQYKLACGLIAVTYGLQTWANLEGQRSDCEFISNGANIDIFRPNRKKPADAPEKYAVFFGGLTRWHGVPVMLDAVKSQYWPKDVKLVIIGDGQETDSVKSAMKTCERIIFLGRLPYKDIAPYVSHALAGLVIINNPGKRSSTGVLPLKLYETLACGIPAIVTDLPGQSDLIKDHKCGIVIPLDDPKALVDAVTFLEQNPKQRQEMGVHGCKAINKRHSWYARSVQTLEFISSVCVK